MTIKYELSKLKNNALKQIKNVPDTIQSVQKNWHSFYEKKRFQLTEYRIGITNNERELLSLKNKYQGHRCFIIGNGPSLRNTDVSKLKNEITISCNGIFLLYQEMGFKPTFYTVEDRLVAEDRADIINNLSGSIKVIPHDLKDYIKQDQETIYINFVRQYDNFPCFSSSFQQIVYWGGTVTFLNLQLAYYLGIREVYLVGMDHNYKAPSAVDEVKGYVIKSNTADVNHFHSDYFGPGYRWHNPQVERMEQSYQVAKKFFEDNGGIIYNATADGKLEVFERVNFDDLF